MISLSQILILNGILFAALAIEGLVSWGRGLHLLTWRDTLANIVIYAGYFAIVFLGTPFAYAVHDRVFAHALFDLTPDGLLGQRAWWVPWVLLVVIEDLCFYVFHRASHQIPLLWAAHSVHHTARTYNFSVALRQSWLPEIALPFWLPLSFLGFDPLAILTVQTCSLFFQSLLHTELIPSFGPLDAILNSPRHHRLHHARDAEFLDKNFGGVFIFWDRLFGSFARGTASGYGTQRDPSVWPWTIEIRPWIDLAVDAFRPRSIAGFLRAVFGFGPVAPPVERT